MKIRHSFSTMVYSSSEIPIVFCTAYTDLTKWQDIIVCSVLGECLDKARLQLKWSLIARCTAIHSDFIKNIWFCLWLGGFIWKFVFWCYTREFIIVYCWTWLWIAFIILMLSTWVLSVFWYLSKEILTFVFIVDDWYKRMGSFSVLDKRAVVVFLVLVLWFFFNYFYAWHKSPLNVLISDTSVL